MNVTSLRIPLLALVSLSLIGLLHAKGRETQRDPVNAYKFLSLAEEKGVMEAAQTRNLIAFKMTSEQIDEAQRLAGEWAPIAENSND